MTVREWALGNGKIIKDSVVRLARFNGGAALNHVQPVLKRVRFGPPPFEYDWDLLVVLDTCRVDAMQAVADEYDFLPDRIDRVRSPASWSRDWLAKSFQLEEYGDEMRRTSFVAWNPFTEYECDAGDWGRLWEVHQEVWDDELSCIPPEEVTDRAIVAGREDDPERLIAWYQQPHAPYRTIETEPLPWSEVGRTDTERHTVWDRVQDPDDPLTREDAWEGHLDNLRWALDEVAVLLENVDAEQVVITADHGELMGEWLGYGHGGGMPFPELVYVPWVETTAVDRWTREPSLATGADTDPDVNERLAALGYAD